MSDSESTITPIMVDDGPDVIAFTNTIAIPGADRLYTLYSISNTGKLTLVKKGLNDLVARKLGSKLSSFQSHQRKELVKETRLLDLEDEYERVKYHADMITTLVAVMHVGGSIPSDILYRFRKYVPVLQAYSETHKAKVKRLRRRIIRAGGEDPEAPVTAEETGASETTDATEEAAGGAGAASTAPLMEQLGRMIGMMSGTSDMHRMPVSAPAPVPAPVPHMINYVTPPNVGPSF